MIFLTALTFVVVIFSPFNDGKLTVIHSESLDSFNKILVFPYALAIYAFIHNTLNERIISNIRYFIYLYLFAVFLQYFFPSIYVSIFSNMVRIIKITEMGGVRGVSALSTEPSFTALILFVFILVVRYTEIFKSKLETWLVILLLCFGIFTTKAVTGFGFVALFLLLEAIQRIEVWKILSVFSIIFALSFLDFGEYRGLSFLLRALTSPELILYESSLFYRVYFITYGVVSLFYNPFGAILGTVDIYEIKNVTDNLFYGHTFPHLFERTIPSSNIPSALAVGLMLYGLIYLFFYIIIFLPTFIKNSTPLIVRILVFAFTAQSFSFGFPLLWFLVVMSELTLWKPVNIDEKMINNEL